MIKLLYPGGGAATRGPGAENGGFPDTPDFARTERAALSAAGTAEASVERPTVSAAVATEATVNLAY